MPSLMKHVNIMRIRGIITEEFVNDLLGSLSSVFYLQAILDFQYLKWSTKIVIFATLLVNLPFQFRNLGNYV